MDDWTKGLSTVAVCGLGAFCVHAGHPGMGGFIVIVCVMCIW